MCPGEHCQKHWRLWLEPGVALSIAVGFRERESRDGKERRKGGGQVQRDRERQRHKECREMLRDPAWVGL